MIKNTGERNLKLSLNSYIGDRAFYKRVLAIALPMIIQNTVTNLVNLLDNLMVGSLGTEQMSGVAIVNQFIFVFNLAVFGAISGAGIFTAQFNGRGDVEGVRQTMRMKLIICAVIGVLGVGVLSVFGDYLITTFLHEGTEGDLALTLLSGEKYLSCIIIGLIPFAFSQVYASTLRETGETVVPMVASVVSIATNFVFNGLLIFGLLGFPELGVEGAAIATAISRFTELFILFAWTHRNKVKCPFAVGVFSNFRIPTALVKQILIKGTPILLNELFWSLSVTVSNQCYSLRGLDVVAAMNISFTLQNLLSVAYFALSSSIAIIVGNLLGAGKLEEAKETDRKLLGFAVFVGCCMTVIQLTLSGVFPLLYNTTDEVRHLSSYIMTCFALTMPAAALATSTYYTIRSGGRVFITMLFDSVYAWVIVMPVVFSLAYFTSLPFKYLLPIVLVVENLKLLPGLILVNKGIWVRQIKVE
ncbi:MAG: MATE family efflux transporter [Clostridia bacterium]|nr:MATE family efflux transporter [Clostridia bacterium]